MTTANCRASRGHSSCLTPLQGVRPGDLLHRPGKLFGREAVLRGGSLGPRIPHRPIGGQRPDPLQRAADRPRFAIQSVFQVCRAVLRCELARSELIDLHGKQSKQMVRYLRSFDYLRADCQFGSRGRLRLNPGLDAWCVLILHNLHKLHKENASKSVATPFNKRTYGNNQPF